MNINVTYRLTDNAIVSISELVEGSVSHFDPNTYGAIQGRYANVRLQAIAVGLDLAEIDTWYLNNGNVPASTPADQKRADMRFGESLLLEFLTGQKDLSLDNTTYRAVSETFKYAEAALRRGDIPQARTELQNIDAMPPVWTAEAKAYFIDKINTYLND